MELVLFIIAKIEIERREHASFPKPSPKELPSLR
jgi:hypothetical protein